uniref:Uncharacterized protein n=1 Tax=Romanomermis culicivorax TaxID=13658 RepID=A0A915I0X3_ROMCU
MSSYNKLVRPVQNSGDRVVVQVKLKLSQLLDIAEKTQIMTTNIWLKQRWQDPNLRWNTSEYGGVNVLYIPSELIWIPDIVLYNNADGKYQGSLMNKAAVYPNGTVIWEPPAIYKSMCPIQIEFFPFDTQDCEMKFRSWTYDGFEVDLIPYDVDDYEVKLEKNKTIWIVQNAVDLSDFYPSAEFDIMAVPACRTEQFFDCCAAPYVDITYTITLRRQTLFYTIHLVIPCVGLAFLCILVFYLPSACGEKVALSISILICLTMFFLLLVEIIPSTSLRVPLIGRYLLFTMVMVTFSIVVTVIQLNFHYRSPNTHHLSPFMRKLFLDILPKFLMMKRPTKDEVEKELKTKSSTILKKTPELIVRLA